MKIQGFSNSGVFAAIAVSHKYLFIKSVSFQADNPKIIKTLLKDLNRTTVTNHNF